MLAIAVLASFGLNYILRKHKNNIVKIIITVIFSGLVMFEFWNYPPFKIVNLSGVPAVYYWLKNQTGNFTIAEYPLDVNGANVFYKFYQTKHEKNMINGTTPGTNANSLSKIIVKLSDPNTAGILSWMAVKYVIVHKKAYLDSELIEWQEELNKITKNNGLNFTRSFPPQVCPQNNILCLEEEGSIDVYEVVAMPIKPELDKGFPLKLIK
jgi:hypothetical protein